MTNDLQLNYRTTALVLIDLQHGIVNRAAGPHTSTDVVNRCVQLGHAFNDAKALIVAVHVAFSADNADRLSQPTDAPTTVPPGGLPADWSTFVPEISALKAPVVITKRQWSAFHGTELDLQLRRRGIDTIVLAGIATNFGVEGTARDAWQHRYSVIVAEDACTSMEADLHRFSVERILPRIARVRSCEAIQRAILIG